MPARRPPIRRRRRPEGVGLAVARHRPTRGQGLRAASSASSRATFWSDGLVRAETLQLVAELGELLAAGHHLGQLRDRDLVLRVGAHHPPELEEHEAVADGIGVVRVVGDEDDAPAHVARLQDVLEHDAGLADAEGGGRLVEDQHPGAEVDGPRDRDGLPLAAGQRADVWLGSETSMPILAISILHDVLGAPLVEEADGTERPRRLLAEEEVAPDRHQRHRREVLEHGGDAVRPGLARAGEADRLAVDEDLALVRREDAGQRS